MKNLYYKGDPEHLEALAAEYQDAGFETELANGELIVYAGKRPTKPKKGNPKAGDKTERWSKRERNFGYTRG